MALLCWMNHHILEAQHAYYMQLNRVAGLFHTTKQGGRLIIYIVIIYSWTGLTNFYRSSLCRGEESSDCHHAQAECYSSHFCTHCQLRPEEGFAISLSLTKGRLCSSHVASQELDVLDMTIPLSKIHICSGYLFPMYYLVFQRQMLVVSKTYFGILWFLVN